MCLRQPDRRDRQRGKSPLARSEGIESTPLSCNGLKGTLREAPKEPPTDAWSFDQLQNLGKRTVAFYRLFAGTRDEPNINVPPAGRSGAVGARPALRHLLYEHTSERRNRGVQP